MPPVNSSQFLGPDRWGQESCVREMGRPPTFQAQELGGEGQLCHLNAKWLVCIFIQQTFITPLHCTENYSRCWGQGWIGPQPQPCSVYVRLGDVIVWIVVWK